MDAKLQTERMCVVGQRLEAGTVGRGGEPVLGRRVAAMVVQAELRVLRIPLRPRIGDKPFHIHDDILPTVGFQILRQPLRVPLEFVLRDRGAVGIPAVPTHRWGSGQPRRLGLSLVGESARVVRTVLRSQTPEGTENQHETDHRETFLHFNFTPPLPLGCGYLLEISSPEFDFLPRDSLPESKSAG